MNMYCGHPSKWLTGGGDPGQTGYCAACAFEGRIEALEAENARLKAELTRALDFIREIDECDTPQYHNGEVYGYSCGYCKAYAKTRPVKHAPDTCIYIKARAEFPEAFTEGSE